MASKLIPLIFIYGIFLIVMGIDGYLHHSTVSLIVAGTCGVLEIGCAAMAKTNPRLGFIGAAAIALLVLGSRLPAALSKGGWAAWISTAFSLVVIVVLLGSHLLAMSKRKSDEPGSVEP